MHGTLVQPAAVDQSEAQSIVKPNARLSANERLAIYQRSYKLRISACMRDQFPALCHALCEPLFNRFVGEYIQAYPPESYTLYDLGRRFSGFLEETRPDKGLKHRETWVDFMVDLTRFERTVFTRFDCQAADLNELATNDMPDECLAVQPSLVIGHFGFDVAGYYHAIRAGDDPQLPDPAPCHLAVMRKNNSTYTLPVSPAHAKMLEAMCNGANIDEALQTVAEWSGRDVRELRNTWSKSGKLRESWIQTGIFVCRD
ncbi:MAG: DNA-binding domain-containing protein [Pseudomonadota bacterium]